MRVCWGANTSPRYAGDGRPWFGRYSQAASSATFSAWGIDPATRDRNRRRSTARGRSSLRAVSCFDWLPGSSAYRTQLQLPFIPGPAPHDGARRRPLVPPDLEWEHDQVVVTRLHG